MKLRNKLILSCAALAAVATTAVSTTFAWYTANDTVKANGITGKTATQDATLLLISETGKQGQWGAAVDITTTGVTLDPVTYMHSDKYVPAKDVTTSATFASKKASLFVASSNSYAAVGESDTFDEDTEYFYKKEAGKYYQWDSSNNQEGAEATGGTAAGNYISFYLYFKSGSTASLPVMIKSLNLRNTTAALPTQTVLAGGTGASGTSYKIDMLRATNIVLTVESSQEVGTGDTSPTVSEDAVRTAYACDSLASDSDDYTAETSSGTAPNITYTGSNAHRYYNNVKTLTGNDAIDVTRSTSEEGYTATDTDKAYGAVATLQGGQDLFTIGNTGAGATGNKDNMLMVRFDIYLDGWDVACFDACRKQTIALDMEFTAVTSN